MGMKEALEELERRKAKARQMGEGEVTKELAEAVKNMDRVSEILTRTLKRLEA